MAKTPKMELTNFTGVVRAAAKADGSIDIELIDVEKQVRTQFGDLTQFAEGIGANGLDTPIVVMVRPDGRYRLIAGERRVRAFRLLGWTQIPARIRRDLSEQEIRGIQVRENNDRENLSAYDEAMGVAEDVANYGFQGAVGIWNRSESWVSKRLSVEKYAPQVLDLLQSGTCGDLEILQSLNQLFGVNVQEFTSMVERMRRGETVSREDARNKVSAAKGWQKQVEAAAKESRRAAAALAEEQRAENDGSAVEPGGALDRGGEEESPAPTGSKSKSKAKSKAKAAGKKPGQTQDRQEVPVITGKETEEALLVTRGDLMHWGNVLRPHFNDMQNKMSALGYPLAEGEWVLWTGFLDIFLPVLHSLGKERGVAYLKRLQGELKAREPMDWWRELHPAVPGSDDEREPAAQMPDGWTF